MDKRWARIYSLLDAKRYTNTKADWTELEQRPNALIDSLVPQGAESRIVCNTIDDDNYLYEAFDLENIGVLVQDEGEAVFQSFLFTTTWESYGFNPFLIMNAEDQLRAFIVGPDCLIAPYDGGMDVILKDPHTCWAFKRQVKNWISPRPDGL